jgi:hypothetical protein
MSWVLPQDLIGIEELLRSLFLQKNLFDPLDFEVGCLKLIGENLEQTLTLQIDFTSKNCGPDVFEGAFVELTEVCTHLRTCGFAVDELKQTLSPTLPFRVRFWFVAYSPSTR